MEEAHRTGIRGHAVRDCLLHTRYPAQHTLSQSVVLLLLHPPHVVVLLLVLHMLFAFEIHIFTLQQRVHYSSGFLCSQTRQQQRRRLRRRLRWGDGDGESENTTCSFHSPALHIQCRCSSIFVQGALHGNRSRTE